eukprot:CAMPEP_0181326088 /NCGR_PEP_ID=MMETSP1101-20121128/21294_1 /TAXON_ID=46948 /ORGANISM="Rhodomonas abbreviata, Strain Caron Lab Isolate" /LENGTH=210 /DNA_ID=CAMNT_0023434483 /DNA_START=173 /DNA_END=802 /DNA_ORIENTATION=+
MSRAQSNDPSPFQPVSSGDLVVTPPPTPSSHAPFAEAHPAAAAARNVNGHFSSSQKHFASSQGREQMMEFLQCLRDGTLDQAAMEREIEETQARKRMPKIEGLQVDGLQLKRERSAGADKIMMQEQDGFRSKKSHRPENLDSLCPGQEFSLIADVADDQSEGVFMPSSPAHDDESMSSRMHTPIPDGSEVFRRSHQTLRGILRSGTRLTE